MTWNIDGTERTALVYSPTKVDPAGAPLILVFHGLSGSTAAQQRSRTWRFDQYWPEAYVVYLQGLPLPKDKDKDKDSNSKITGFQSKPNIQGNRDLRFVDAVLDDFKKDKHVDRKRVYAMGFSNGTTFVFVLWSERPSSFAAFAPCSHYPYPTLKLNAPKPAFITAGQTDKVVPLQSEEETIERLRKLNGATADGKPIEGGVTVYESTKDAPIETLIHAGGHVLPKEAPKLIVDFFRAQSLKR